MGLLAQAGKGKECARGAAACPALGVGWEGLSWGGVTASHRFPKNPARVGPPSALILLAPHPDGKESQVWGKWIER